MTVAQAVARHKAAQAALDAGLRRGNCPRRLQIKEGKALDALAFTPCASDAEFLEKLRYLAGFETRLYGPPDGKSEFGSVAVAVDLHFNNPDYFDFTLDCST